MHVDDRRRRRTRSATGKVGAFTLLWSLIAAPAWGLSGFVIDARSRGAIAGAEVTIVGERGSVRTGADGGFEWELPTVSSVVFVVILPDGRVGRPIPVTLVGASVVTLSVEATVIESLEVSGAAPEIDVSAGTVASLVSGADISLRHPVTVGQILENVPGVSLISEGQSATPAIRGLARGRTSILVDGVRASTERRAGPNASFLDPALVDRVEVARGPASVAYGSDAMGGVIAVRTRRPAFDRPLQIRFSGTVGGGVPETRGDVEVASGYGTGGVLLGVRARNFDSYDAPNGLVPNSGWHDQGLRARWEHDTGSALWSVGWQTDLARDIGRPRSDSDVVLLTTPFEDSHRLTVSYDRRALAGFTRLRLDGGVGSLRQLTEQNRLPATGRPQSLEQTEVGSRDVQLRAKADRMVGDARVQVGADLDARYGLEATDTVVSYTGGGVVLSTAKTPSIDAADRTAAGLFTQTDLQLWPLLRLSGGLRVDVVHSANSGGHFGDREITHAAVAGSGAVTVAAARRLTLTAQLSRGFREPMLSDRFYRGPVGRGFIEGNPDLDPETSLQVDVTARYDTGRVAIVGALYDYRISSLIERYQAGPASFRYRNRGAARLQGAEVEARAVVAHGLAIGVAAQASRGRDEDTGTAIDDVAPEAVSIVARHAVGVVSSYLRIAAVAAHHAAGPSEVPTPAFSLVDAGAAWRIGRRLRVLGVVRNLLNEAFYSSAGPRWVHAPGRHGSVTMIVEF